jgi:hypothetical protein
MTDEDALQILARLSAAYGNKHLTEPETDVWLDYLHDFEYDDAQDAVDRSIRGDQFFPSIARFRELAKVSERAAIHRGEALRALPAPGYSDDHYRETARAAIAGIREQMGWTPEVRADIRQRIASVEMQRRKPAGDRKPKRDRNDGMTDIKKGLAKVTDMIARGFGFDQ